MRLLCLSQLRLCHCAVLIVMMASWSSAGSAVAQDLEELQVRVADLFNRSCARVGCHAGSDPQMGMSLAPNDFVGHTVTQPSRERPDLQLIHPGQPDSSYLLMKVRGDDGIIGLQMPMTGNKLSEGEIAAIEERSEEHTSELQSRENLV